MPHLFRGSQTSRLTDRCSRRAVSKAAFTLVELLVVIAILMLLIATMLPTLASAKESARAVLCQSNLKTLQLAWQNIRQNDRLIPHTKSIFNAPNWIEKLDAVYPDAPSVYGTNVQSFGACPTVQLNYQPMYYQPYRWGYAVNSWWSNSGGGGELNERKPWAKLKHPSQYPWMMDVEPYDWGGGSGFHARWFVPTTTMAQLTDWGVGANHGNRNMVNTAFADTSVRSVDIQTIRDEAPGSGDYTWFENR